MTDIQAHRGPDDFGYALFGIRAGVSCAFRERVPTSFEDRTYDLGFGHRRLSIIDLSAAGHQPMSSPDNDLWIIYNGEIYNHMELRAELEAEGHSFFSQSDTEVILQSYRRWGVGCLSRFNGMWAFALWDVNNRTLFCSRDRLGKKPFYYYKDDKTFIFASEIKALLCHPRVPRRVNEAKVFDYLYLQQQEYKEDSFFQGISQLPAASSFLVHADGRIDEQRWWEVPLELSSGWGSRRSAEQDNARELLSLMLDAVKIRLRSDVPVGVALSGGVDSTLVFSLAHEQFGDHPNATPGTADGRLATFTSRPVGTSWDEGRFVDELTERLDVERNDVFPLASRFWQELPELVWHQDQPFSSTSMYAHWNIMRAVRDSGTTVLLEGQGADELFGGYDRFYSSYHVQLALERCISGLIAEARGAASLNGESTLRYLQVVAYALLPWRLRLWAHRAHRLRGGQRKAISSSLVRRHRERALERRRQQEAQARNLQAASYDATTLSTLPQLLRCADRNSMAMSVESRMPFLDHRVLAFAFATPAAAKIHNGWRKHVLREASVGILPDVIRLRYDKMGFPTPEAQWLREGKDHMRSLLTKDPMCAEFVDIPYLRSNLDSLLDVDTVAVPEVWRPVCLEYWLRRYFGNVSTEQD